MKKSRPRLPIVDLCIRHTDCVNRTAPVVDYQTPYKMIRTSNVGNGFIDIEKVRYVSESIYKKWTRRMVPQRGDVILTREAPLGEVGKIRTDDQIFLGQRLYHFRTDPNKLNADFLLYSLLHDDLQGQIKGFGSGSTVEHMRLEDIPSLKISLPPISEQRKIAAILSAYDDLIENNTRRIKILEEMAQTIYREWFVNFRFPGHEEVNMVESELGMIPEGWEVKKLGEVIELLYGKALTAKKRKMGSVPVYGSGGVIGCHNESLVSAPGIIVGRKGNVGSVYWSSLPFFPIDTVFYVKTGLSLYYAFYDLQRQHFVNGDAAVPGLSRNQAYCNDILVPPQQIQDIFESLAKPIFHHLDILSEKNQNLRRTRDMLLPKLISGEVDVSELDIKVDR